MRIAVLLSLVLSSCVVRAGRPPPRHHWWWHRRVEVTNPVSSDLTIPQSDTVPVSPQ